MDSSHGFLGNPYLWALISAAFLAAAGNRASRPAGYPRWRAGDPDKARTTKWTCFSLYLSLALAVALAGLLVVPASRWVGDPVLPYFTLGAAALLFLVFRFKRTVGVAVIVLAVALAMALLLFLRSLTAFTGETEIGRVRVLAADEQRMTLELLVPERDPQIVELDGIYFGPLVRLVIFDDAFVFLGAKSWYRFEELRGYDRDLKDRSIQPLAEPEGISQWLWRRFEDYDNRIPGVRSVQVDIALKRVRAPRARELSTYSLRVQNDGGLQIIDMR